LHETWGDDHWRFANATFDRTVRSHTQRDHHVDLV
jgi:hypothetical protein